MATPQRLTPESAAMTLAIWMHAHNRVPKAHDCIPANGLPHWTSIYRTFSSLPAFISAACGILSTFSCLPSSPVSKVVPRKITIACLGGCGRTITVERQKDIRHCAHCRRNLFRRGADDTLANFSAHIRFDCTDFDDIDWDPL